MKILRKILSFILGVVLSLLIGGLLLSFAVKSVIQEELIGGAIKDQFIPMITESTELSEEDKKIVEEMFEDKEVNDMVNQMVDEIFETMTTDDGEISEETINSIFDYVISNKDKIEEVTGEEIDLSSLEEVRNSDEFKNVTKELTESINESAGELDDTSKTAIKTYTYMVSNECRLVLLGLIVLDLILIALVQWSPYKWMSTLGKALTTSGLTLLLLYFIMNKFIEALLSEQDITFNINTSSILTMGIICVIGGVLLVVIKLIIDNIIKNKKVDMETNYNAVS
ncbi:MAG: hypothetical protein Q4E69_02960 [Bacilli bacterium]|nr:hypothetical protein [Bacilli bacterium]